MECQKCGYDSAFDFESCPQCGPARRHPATRPLAWVLKTLMGLQLLVLAATTLAVAAHRNGTDAGVFLFVNGCLAAFKILLIVLVLRALYRGSTAACYIVLIASVVGLAYTIFSFKPDHSFRYLGLSAFMYGVSIVNLLLSVTAAVFSIRAIRTLRAETQSVRPKDGTQAA